jgi:glucans biosynthesis protein
MPRPTGRSGWGWLLAGLACAAAARSAGAITLDEIAGLARLRATHAYEDPRGGIPDWLLQIDYDHYRRIRFRPERALWRDRGLPFSVQFFHPGFYYDRAVRIHVVSRKGVVSDAAFSPDQFDYGDNTFESRIPHDLGYAGFRIHYPIKTASYQDEVAVFLGASYFRAVGRDQVYGLSARGVAIDTALASGEEFPWFREFWLVQPRAGARELTVYALLDSPSATGAYRFVVAPGPQTRIDVELRLFARSEISKLGIAPLTSMFQRGEDRFSESESDYRPEVHDSDGLLVASGTGEWLWRPLANPRELSVTSFELSDPHGFGLIQRDRRFDHYQDLEARPELRPSTWVEPKGNWGAGRVELVDIPTRNETNDNVVAYWVPRTPIGPGVPVSFAYSLFWYGDDRARPPGGRAVDTRSDDGTREGARRFVVDFEGDALRRLAADAVVEGVVTVVAGGASGGGAARPAELLEQQVMHNPATGGRRLVFQIERDSDPVELRAFLRHGDDVLTETWSYLLMP